MNWQQNTEAFLDCVYHLPSLKQKMVGIQVSFWGPAVSFRKCITLNVKISYKKTQTTHHVQDVPSFSSYITKVTCIHSGRICQTLRFLTKYIRYPQAQQIVTHQMPRRVFGDDSAEVGDSHLMGFQPVKIINKKPTSKYLDETCSMLVE